MSSVVVRRVAALLGSGLVATTLALPAAGADSSGGSTVGFTPPTDPSYICQPHFSGNQHTFINHCRDREGIGPMTLPSNYSSLTPGEQELVVFNLERINRGEAPIVGLNASLNSLAHSGANKNEDPDFPSDATGDERSIWAASTSVLGADYEWMYYDECTDENHVGCWGHRDSILTDTDTQPLVAGVGFKADGFKGSGFSDNSYAAVFVYGYHPDSLTFTWASELKYFASPPAAEPLGTPHVTSVTSTHVSTGGGQTVTIKGTQLVGTSTVAIDGIPVSKVSCVAAGTSCKVKLPAHAAGQAILMLSTPNASAAPVTLTYADPVLAIVGGNHQTMKHGHGYKKYLRVSGKVGGSLVPGLPITYKVTSGKGEFQGGGPGDPETAKTRSNGVAQPDIFFGLGHAGSVIVTASAPGASPVTFTLTVT